MTELSACLQPLAFTAAIGLPSAARLHGDETQSGTSPHAWSGNVMPPPASIMHVCIEQAPASRHSALDAHSCGNSTAHVAMHVPSVDAVEEVVTRQQTAASPHADAEVHVFSEVPESGSV